MAFDELHHGVGRAAVTAHQFVFQPKARIAKWVVDRIPHMGRFEDLGPYEVMGISSSDGMPLAGVVWTNYRGHDITLNLAADSPRWARRGVITAILSYPFRQLQCERCTSFVGRQNKRSYRITEGVGFKREGLMRRAADGWEDVHVFGMLREEFEERWGKYLKEREDGQEIVIAAGCA